jgi:hypothetical protein
MEYYAEIFTSEARLSIWSNKSNKFHVNNRILFLNIWTAIFIINELYNMPTE